MLYGEIIHFLLTTAITTTTNYSWVMIYEKAYQVDDTAKVAVTTKLKGNSFSNLPDIPGIGKRLWDIPDVVVPPLEHNAFFITTNLVRTPKQKLGECPEGGVIGIDINWECDLDWNIRYCNPVYTFTRLDDANAPIARGFNFRYANYYYINDTLHRDLIKAHGIRVLINAHGKAGKFHILPLTMNIGSGLALLSLAPVVCDIIALNLLKSKSIYQKAKFESIVEEQQKIKARRESRVPKRIVLNSEDPIELSSPGHGNGDDTKVRKVSFEPDP